MVSVVKSLHENPYPEYTTSLLDFLGHVPRNKIVDYYGVQVFQLCYILPFFSSVCISHFTLQQGVSISLLCTFVVLSALNSVISTNLVLMTY